MALSSSISALPAIPSYLTITKNETQAVSNFAETSPSTQRIVAAFQKAAPSINSAADLLGNYQALQVVLGASNLSSLLGQTAVLRDLMTQNPSDPKSLAATSGNASWKTFAQTYSTWDPSPFSSADTVASISQNYMTSSFETQEQTQTPGLGNALYFTRTMPSVTSVSEIMADPKLLNVAETVAGFDPTQFGALDYDEQVRLLTPKIDMNTFSTSEGIQKYAEQYLAMLQIHPQATTTPATMLTLYGAGGSNNGILALFGYSTESSSSLFSALT